MQSGPVYYRRKHRFLGLFVLAVTFIAAFGHVLSAEENGSREKAILRSRVYKFTHISNSEAKKHLVALNLGTDINELPQNALIVTSDKPSDLTKTSSVLRFIDSAEKREIRTILIASEKQELPQISEIPDKIDDIFILSFRDTPDSTMTSVALVDIQDSRLIAIANVDLLDRIVESLEKLEPGAAKDEPEAVKDKPETTETPIIPEPKPLAIDTTKAGVTPPLPKAVDAEPKKPEVDIMDVMGLLDEATGPDKTEKPVAGKVVFETQPTMTAKKPTQELPTQEDFFGDELLDALAEAGAKPLEETSRPPTAAIETAPPVEPVIEPVVEPIRKPVIEPVKQAPETKTEIVGQASTPLPRRPVAAVAKPAAKPIQTPTTQTKPQAPPIKETAAEPTLSPEDQAEVSAHQADISKLLQALAQSEAGKPIPEPKPPRAIAETPAKPVKEEPVAAKAKPGPPRISHDEHMAQMIADPEKELETVLILPEKVTVQALIELVGKQLGLNYVYDVTTVKGDVMLKIHDGKIKVKDVYALLESVLKFKALVMVRRGNLVMILPTSQAQNYDPTIITSVEDIRPGDVIVTSVFHLEHIATATAENMLTRMKLGAQGFNSIPETGTLVVTDYAYRMDRIEQLLDMIDVAGEERKFHSRMLEYMIASKLAGKVEILARQLGTIEVTIAASKAPTVTRIDPRTKKPIPVPPSRTPATAVKKGVYVDTDDRTNRIIMIGIKDDIDVLNDLIDSLDVPQQGLKSVMEYKINFVEAVEVVNVLKELGLIQVNASGGTSSARPTIAKPPTSGGAGATEAAQISIRLDSNALLVNATSEQHSAIKMVISYVDVAQEDRGLIREYEIQFVDTTEIMDTLGELGIIESTSARRTSSSSTARPTVPAAKPGTPASTAPRLTGAAEDITADQPQIAILEATNSLLVKATPAQHDAIAMIIAHVDRELDEVVTPYVIYALENQDPAELADTLNELIRETTTEVPKDSKVQSKPVVSVSQEEERIKIIPDVATYSLIVFANKKNQQWISALITTLDEYRPQVLLDVTLVEISQDNEFNFDLDMVSKFPTLAEGGSMTSLTKAGITGVSGLLESFPGNRITEASVTNGSGVAFYADNHIQALLKLMDKKSYGRILARPSLLVRDNQEGQIKAEKKIFVAEEKTNVITGEGGNISTASDIQFKDYSSGVTLTITPHIASEKLLQLDIVLDRTDFVTGAEKTATIGDKTVPKPLDTVSSNVSTYAVVPDGATIILGGIETMTQTKIVTKIPLLGDIPLIGTLFRGIDESDEQSKLYVFVKANIIQPGDELSGKSDIEVISQKKRRAFEEEERLFQNLQTMPGVEPEVLDPLTILEDDDYIRELRDKNNSQDTVVVEVELE